MTTGLNADKEPEWRRNRSELTTRYRPRHFGNGRLLVCPRGHRFDARHAGISPDRSECHLDPLPLVASEGVVKVAVR